MKIEFANKYLILLILLFSPTVIFTQNDIKTKSNTAEMHGYASQRVEKKVEKKEEFKKVSISKVSKQKTNGNDGFTSAKIVKKENVSAEKMVIYSYIAFFMLILLYTLFISRKINKVSKKIDQLESLKE